MSRNQDFTILPYTSGSIANAIAIDSFVKQHQYGIIFHTTYMFECFNKIKNYHPFIYYALNDNKEILGLISGVNISYFNVRSILTSRAVIMGGPIAIGNDQDVLFKLLDHMNLILRKRSLFSEIRNSNDNLPVNDAFQKAKFKFEDHLNFLIKIHPEKDLLSSLPRSKRKTIRQSLKNDLTFKVVDRTDPKEVQKAYSILKLVYKRLKLPLLPLDLILNCSKSSGENGELVIFSVNLKGKIIGIRIALLYKGIMIGWYAGSDSNYYKYFPNDFLVYKTLEWGKNNGQFMFDFGGAGKPNRSYGVRDFKSKFGGDLVNYGRYIRVYHPISYFFANSIFRIIRKITLHLS